MLPVCMFSLAHLFDLARVVCNLATHIIQRIVGLNCHCNGYSTAEIIMYYLVNTNIFCFAYSVLIHWSSSSWNLSGSSIGHILFWFSNRLHRLNVYVNMIASIDCLCKHDCIIGGQCKHDVRIVLNFSFTSV
jgi:hypothetical protein